ncbi:ATP-binding protein [Candidatus Poribacteria bacterium]|nr:ATP-binding protein [Candidatus Poribacteria bacterium]
MTAIESPEFREIPDEKMPPFFQEMAARFLSRQSNQFLLTGNVADLVDGLGVVCSAGDRDEANRFGLLDGYLSKRLERRGRLVITYNIARGINFTSNEQFNALREFYMAGDAAGPVTKPAEQERRAARFDRTIAESQVYSFLTLRFLEEVCLLARKRREGCVAQGITILVKHADTLLPDSPVSQMSDIDRQKLTLLSEWFTDPGFLESLEQMILIAPTAAGIHENLRRLPHLSIINIPLPGADERREFIRWMNKQTGRTIKMKRSQRELAEITAGMTRLTLQNIFLQAQYKDGTLDESDILELLNRLLASELGDKIEISKPRHTMADVIGASALKTELGRLRALLESRDPSVAPVGVLVAGPNGVGKTFIFEAWAAECNRLVIELKNLRSMYFGQTDQIFEKLRNVLEALGNVIVFIDEADTMFGRPGINTHETEARLFGNLIRMMGDPKNRGRIVWILLTARPDNLAPDLKRSGRAGLHLPVFDPEGDDRRAYIEFVLSRAGFDAKTLSPEERAELERRTAELSPADFNEVVVELRAERQLAKELTFARVLELLDNIMPGQIADQRRIQVLNAYMECSRRSLLPPSLAGLSRADAERELEALRARVR